MLYHTAFNNEIIMIIMAKRKVQFFVSYARSNKSLASVFIEKFDEQLSPSKQYEYKLWRDTEILVGEKWDSEIQKAIASCDFGILLVSPRFLGSSYITENELPAFIGDKAKPVLPIMLQPVDLQRHDLKGINDHQIFRFDAEGFKQPRSFAECKGNRRNDFAQELFRQVEGVLDKKFA